jgi:hypothetical protein
LIEAQPCGIPKGSPIAYAFWMIAIQLRGRSF